MRRRYQNTVRDVTVQAVDIGVFFGVQVNANQVSGVMMEAIGQVRKRRYPPFCSTHVSHERDALAIGRDV